MSKYIDVATLDKLESLAREAVRTAISAVIDPTMAARAQEAMREFHAAADPQTVVDLITTYHTYWGGRE